MKILIVKTSALGDIIQAFSVIDYLHSVYPAAQIDWVVEKPFSELLEAHSLIHHVHPVNTKQWRREGLFSKKTRQEIKKSVKDIRTQKYDLVIDLQGNIKSGLLTAVARSRVKVGFGYASVPEFPNIIFTNKRYNPPKGLNIRDEYLFLAQSAVGCYDFNKKNTLLRISLEEECKIETILDDSRLKAGKKIMICCGSNWTNKQLTKSVLKDFLYLVKDNIHGRFLFIWGTQEEKGVVDELSSHFPSESVVVDRLALPTLQNLMQQVDLVISMDSLPLHLAGTTATPTYGIFGASLGSKYSPIGSRSGFFQGSCPYGKTFEKRCPILRSCSTGACIKNILPNELYNAFITWWTNLVNV